jgi:hypothetical protein
MTGTMTFQIIELSSWNILYINVVQEPAVSFYGKILKIIKSWGETSCRGFLIGVLV